MKRAFLGVLLLAATLPAAAGGRAKKPPSAAEKGTKLYAEGKLPQALALFRGVLRRDPGDQAARKAVARIEQELRLRAPVRVEADRDDWIDDLDEALAAGVPRLVNFENTLGDAVAGVGTLEASRGRVEQLLAERRFALKKGRRFAKERELRAQLRRLPAIVG